MTYDDAFRFAKDGELRNQSDADLQLLLQACLAVTSGNIAFNTQRDSVIAVILDEIARRKSERQHEQQLAEHSKLQTSVGELKKPHWTLAPIFWVSVFTMIFAA